MSGVDFHLDLETLGTKPGCVVLQIGCIAVRSASGEVLASFGANIDVGSSLLAGLAIDPETVAWWARQSAEARASVYAPGRALGDVVRSWRQFWQACGGDRQSRLYVRGADFDPAIWAAAMDAADGGGMPWRYDRVRDMRTALDELGLDRVEVPRRGPAHVAMWDAMHDRDCLVAGRARLAGGGAANPSERGAL